MNYGPALEIADKILTFKTIIQSVVQKFGFIATFMAKPIAGINGSGMHIHQSLFDLNGNNVFYSSGNQYNLSDIAYYFIAGQMKHARALSAVVAPTVNVAIRPPPYYAASPVVLTTPASSSYWNPALRR